MSRRAIWRIQSSVILAAFERLIESRASFTGHVAINLAGNLLSRLITLASVAAVTRLYAAGDYGQWVVVLSLASCGVSLATMRYDIAVVIAPTRQMAAALVLVIAVGALVMTFVSAATVIIAPAYFVSKVSGLAEGQRALILLVPLVLLLLTLQTALQAWMTREHKFQAMSLSQLVQALVTALVTIGLPFVAGASAKIAAAGAIIGLACGTLVCAWVSAKNLFEDISSDPASNALDGMRRFKVYPLYMLPYSLSSILSERILQLVIAAAYSTGTLGAYYVARQISSAPGTIVSVALRQAMFAHSARKEQIDVIKGRVERVLTLLIEVVAPALAYCLVWSSPIVNFLLGSRWTDLNDFIWWSLFPGEFVPCCQLAR